MIVIRINRHGELCNARPCHHCLNLMKKVGINKIYYSINKNILICEKIKNMISIHISYPMKIMHQLHYNLPKNNYDYFKKILNKSFPKIIKKYNLECFLNYNYYDILPSFSHKINKKKNIVQLIDMNGNIINESNLI